MKNYMIKRENELRRDFESKKGCLIKKTQIIRNSKRSSNNMTQILSTQATQSASCKMKVSKHIPAQIQA